MRIQYLNHSVYQHQYHIVWGTKWNRKWLKAYVKPVLLKSLNQTIEKYPIFHLEKMNTDEDHVHVQIEIPPNVSVSSAVQKLKQHSSIDLKKRFKFIKEMYLDDSIWRVGYFSSTIGLNEEIIRKYIDQQGKQDDMPQPVLF